MQRKIVAALLFGLLSMIGCEPDQPAARQEPAPVTSPATAAPALINPELIELTDGSMRRSKTFSVNGDLRPFWLVSGRLKNESSSELKSVTIRITVTSKASSEVIDGATLQIDTDIPSGAVGSFAREIQLMPPDTGGWDWTYDIIKAVPK